MIVRIFIRKIYSGLRRSVIFCPNRTRQDLQPQKKGGMMNSYGKFDEYVKLAANNTEKAAEIVAKSFYKILRKNGFDNAQIMNVANNILDCLIHSLEGYEEKTRMKSERQDKPINQEYINSHWDKVDRSE